MADDDGRLTAVRELEAAFGQMMSRLRQTYARAAESISPGLLPFAFNVLWAVRRSGPTTLSELAASLGADKGQVSRSVTELERIGLVERTTAPGDGRSKTITISESGREAIERAWSPNRSRFLDAVEGWSEAEIRKVNDLLARLGR